MAKRTILVVAIFMLILFAVGCNANKQEEKEPKMGKIDYEIVITDAIPKELEQWYEENYQVEGLHQHEIGENRYLLLSAGEKPTGGYSIENLELLGYENEIELKAELNQPSGDSIVTQVLTYPHILVKIERDNRQLRYGGITETINHQASEILQDSGTYIGQIDNNSIEVRISGVQPDDFAIKVFRISEEAREEFSTFSDGDEVLISYYLDENQQPIMTSIKSISN
ncbi:MAG: hypothetical protein APF76_01185 [Desulfitibacter sp. BRH_c19]|nr:MAG: hypothetical protein APF76_01185 [Desulfitibacter sp. BRH_c19]